MIVTLTRPATAFHHFCFAQFLMCAWWTDHFESCTLHTLSLPTLQVQRIIASYRLQDLLAVYVPGTRQWLYDRVNAWLDTATSSADPASIHNRMFLLLAGPGMVSLTISFPVALFVWGDCSKLFSNILAHWSKPINIVSACTLLHRRILWLRAQRNCCFSLLQGKSVFSAKAEAMVVLRAYAGQSVRVSFVLGKV